MNLAWAYTVAYNEAALIPYWVRHHLTFCDRVIVYADPDCDDNTAALAECEGAEVRDSFSSRLDDDAFVGFANAQWQEAVGQAQWVVWLDADEFLYHPRARQRLTGFTKLGITLPRTVQYVMASPQPPTHPGHIYDLPQFRKGVGTDAKQAPIFNPNALFVQWVVGKHYASIRGTVCKDDDDDPFMLLHYRWLGEEYLRARDAKNYSRMTAHEKAGHLGFHCYPGFVGPYDPGWTDVRPADARELFTR